MFVYTETSQNYLKVKYYTLFYILVDLKSLKIVHFACHISRNLTMLHSINIMFIAIGVQKKVLSIFEKDA